MITKKVERVHNGTSLPEQIIYNWLKGEFGEENVINRDKSHNDLEFDIYIKPLELLIEYGDRLYHNYKSDIREKDIEKVKYAKENNIKLLRVFNDGETDTAYLDKDLIVFNIKVDKFMNKQVLPLISNYIGDCYGVYINANTMNEKVLAQAIANTYYSSYKDSFGEKYSELAKYWCNSENFGINPNAISITCPYEFIFSCPKCGHRFKNTIQNFIDDSVCKCCGHNVRFEEEEEVSIFKMKGMHSNIECFILNNNELHCGYNEIIYSVISSAIDTGNANKLVNSKIIKHISNIKGLKSYTLIGEYGVKIPKKVQIQYDLLMNTIVSLNIDFSDFKVKVKQKEYETIKICNTQIFNIKAEMSIIQDEDDCAEEERYINESIGVIRRLPSESKYSLVYENRQWIQKLNSSEIMKNAFAISSNQLETNKLLFFMGMGHMCCG